MKPTTIIQKLVLLQALEQQIRELHSEMNRCLFSKEIQAIASNWTFDREATRLAFQIEQRDFPLTRTEIVQVFKESGFEFNSLDIDACRPDADQATREYRSEQAADYASVYGDSN